MFDTMKATKVLAAVAGALLIFLFANWGASSLYTVGDAAAHGDGEEHAVVRGFVIASGDGAAEDDAEPEVELTFAEVYAAADVAAGEKVYGKCKACHKLEEGANATGPSLYGIVGHPKAEIAGFGYSDALLAMQGETWTPENLDAWLASPKDYAPGNKMTFAGLKKIEERANLIAYLATIGG